MRDTVEITPNMNLGIQSPEETVMEERITESKLRSIIRECLTNLFENIDEKAKSKAQQRFMGMVDAYKKGEMSDASPAIKKAAKSMTKKEVKDFAKTKHKGLPEHVDETCDGTQPYCDKKQDMIKAEKNSPDKPIDFTKKQSKIKLSEGELRKIVKETISNLMPQEQDSVYSMKDWERDGTLKVKEGQLISPEVYWELLGSVPPITNGNIFQPGEAYDYDWKNNTQLYQTFERVGRDKYRYVGLRPAGRLNTLNENSLRKIVRKVLNEITIDTADNAYMKALADADTLPATSPQRARRAAQAANIKQLRNGKLGFDPNDVASQIRKQGTSGDASIDRRYATWHKNHMDRLNGKRTYDDARHRWQTKLEESVHQALIKTLGKYTQGKATAEQANKAIMDLANSSNSINERKNRSFYDYADEYMKKNGKKLPDEILKNAAKKNDERFFNRK